MMFVWRRGVQGMRQDLRTLWCVDCGVWSMSSTYLDIEGVQSLVWRHGFKHRMYAQCPIFRKQSVQDGYVLIAQIVASNMRCLHAPHQAQRRVAPGLDGAGAPWHNGAKGWVHRLEG